MFGLFRNRARDAQIARLYDQILAQSRDPALFIEGRVPDTVEGRTDMMLLHLFLLMHRLNDEQGEIREIAQGVCDRFFAELDRAMREMGVGDLAVPKKMRKIADIYTGCSSSYGNALHKPDDEELTQVLLRNVYARDEARLPQARALAGYVRRASNALGDASLASLASGSLPFPTPALGESA
ncbi:ubiquinol-cytochrome C chaperone [Labrys sp. LIt4]|uniref:ubiquinol-cytochrome C chaperone family protein n=1 Tax=Labrys sp. LIt4 TaxID=2821355 RepID=UPI001ADF8943|nr:ubiquinol-cytochrome C chaperone family protein [Labrys sp. LIt4]MBP0579008.1 ubiquinol-cytochrome C chaperone [Labrys sp. LIt4]